MKCLWLVWYQVHDAIRNVYGMYVCMSPWNDECYGLYAFKFMLWDIWGMLEHVCSHDE